MLTTKTNLRMWYAERIKDTKPSNDIALLDLQIGNDVSYYLFRSRTAIIVRLTRSTWQNYVELKFNPVTKKIIHYADDL